MRTNKLLSVIALFIAIPISAYAAAVYLNDNGEYSSDVDKFVPQTGVKVKNSQMANWLENSTRNAMDGNKNNYQKKNAVGQSQRYSSQSNRKSYKWF